MRHSYTVSQHGLASDVSRRITSPRDHAPPIAVTIDLVQGLRRLRL